jgi:endonuclease YncB( thermonuclease family)
VRRLIAVLALAVLFVPSFAVLTALPAAAQVGTKIDEDDLPDDAQEAYFLDIVDGDTFEAEILDDDGRTTEVIIRLIGIDTPETSYAYGNEPECYGQEAKSRTEGLLLYAEEIWLVADVDDTDDFGRLLRYVYFRSDIDDNIYLLNEVLVREGYALAKTYRPNTELQDDLDRAERRAIENANGMWLTCDASVSMDPDLEQDGEPDDEPADTSNGAPESEEDAACALFDTQQQAQEVLDRFPELADSIDLDEDGEACEDWFR